MKRNFINLRQFAGASLLLVAVLLSSCGNDTEIKIGERYLHSWNFNDDDPFTLVNVDTVTVLDIKNEYVLYQFKSDGVKLHNSLRVFRACIKPCY